MPRARTSRIEDFKVKLLDLLNDGFRQPGQRFPSTRALAMRYGVSFQTAHRIVGELVEEGRLVRRAGSGTYIAGQSAAPKRVLLLFHPRAKRRDSFGAHLLDLMEDALSRSGVDYVVRTAGSTANIPKDAYPVFWENASAAHAQATRGRYGLVLNDTPPSGIAGSYIDSVSTDNYSGGLCAAEVLGSVLPKSARIAIIAGPRQDVRCQQRVDGFRSLRPASDVYWTRSWDHEAGAKAAQRMANATQGCFCVNDRLAGGLLSMLDGANRSLPVVGFDDAPLAEALGLTTIAIPWEGIVKDAISIIERRFAGDTINGRQHIFAPRPVVRHSHCIH